MGEIHPESTVRSINQYFRELRNFEDQISSFCYWRHGQDPPLPPAKLEKYHSKIIDFIDKLHNVGSVVNRQNIKKLHVYFNREK